MRVRSERLQRILERGRQSGTAAGAAVPEKHEIGSALSERLHAYKAIAPAAAQETASPLTPSPIWPSSIRGGHKTPRAGPTEMYVDERSIPSYRFDAGAMSTRGYR